MKILLALLLATPAAAGQLSDAILAPGALADMDRPAIYEHVLRKDGAETRDTLTLRPGARLVLYQGDRPVSDFAPQSAHPVVIYFLESTATHMAEATGGSPFYIRNRIREALSIADGMEITPFAADANRAKMGDFADLTLRFETEGTRVLSLSADTASGQDGYHESMTLEED